MQSLAAKMLREVHVSTKTNVLCRAHLRRALRDKDDSVCSQQRPRGLVEERHLHIRANACMRPGFSYLPISNRMAPLPSTQHTLTDKPTPTGSHQSYMSP